MWELFAGVKLDSLHRSGVKWDASQFGHLKGGKNALWKLGTRAGNPYVHMYVCKCNFHLAFTVTAQW